MLTKILTTEQFTEYKKEECNMPQNNITISSYGNISSVMFEDANIHMLLNKLFAYANDTYYYKTVADLNYNDTDKSYYFSINDGIVELYDNDIVGSPGMIAIWYNGIMCQKLYSVEYNVMVNQVTQFVTSYQNCFVQI